MLEPGGSTSVWGIKLSSAQNASCVVKLRRGMALLYRKIVKYNYLSGLTDIHLYVHRQDHYLF